MRNKLLIILFTLFCTQSYSQDFGEIKIDSKLQIKHSDTLKNIGERLTGKWKYLGIKNDGILSDTLFSSYFKKRKKIVTVENGILYELENGKKSKADYYYEITYSFKDNRGFYSEDKKYINKDILEISTCQPVPELIVYKDKFGILFIGMSGQNFDGILKLNDNSLVMENGKEYLRVE